MLVNHYFDENDDYVVDYAMFELPIFLLFSAFSLLIFLWFTSCSYFFHLFIYFFFFVLVLYLPSILGLLS